MWEFPNIDPVVISLGPFDIRWYALAYLAGFLLGWRYCLKLADLDPDHRPDRMDIDDFLPWAIAGVIFGGRLGYVLFYQFEYYVQNPLVELTIFGFDFFIPSFLALWQGGMSFHGGALGVIVALLIYPSIHKFSHLRLADIVCACVPLGIFFGRVANFVNGELFGRVTNSPLGMVFPRGGPYPRHPSQLYEAALEGLLLFAVLFVLVRNDWVRSRPGIVSGVFLAGYGLARAFVEFFREPDAHIGFIIGAVSMGQVLSIPMVLAGVGLVVYAVLRKRSNVEPA